MTFPAKTTTVLFAVLCIAAAQSSIVKAAGYDYGPITLIVDDTIYVDGTEGVYALELLGICSWCEEGMEVLINFLDAVTATVRPYNGKSAVSAFKPVRTIIIRDGRYGD